MLWCSAAVFTSVTSFHTWNRSCMRAQYTKNSVAAPSTSEIARPSKGGSFADWNTWAIRWCSGQPLPCPELSPSQDAIPSCDEPDMSVLDRLRGFCALHLL